MILNTVIFDMDGLLIDSEPLWYEAAQESLKQFNVHIVEEEYNTTTGLRTPEFLQHWFKVFEIDVKHLSSTEEDLLYGKPHPQVFLDCASALQSEPTNCICIEDSFNGLIAAKAAKMKCIIVPHSSQFEMDKWNIADLKLKSLRDLTHSSLEKILK